MGGTFVLLIVAGLLLTGLTYLFFSPPYPNGRKERIQRIMPGFLCEWLTLVPTAMAIGAAPMIATHLVTMLKTAGVQQPAPYLFCIFIIFLVMFVLKILERWDPLPWIAYFIIPTVIYLAIFSPEKILGWKLFTLFALGWFLFAFKLWCLSQPDYEEDDSD